MELFYKILANKDKHKILIYGDVVLDKFCDVISKRISSECPVIVYESSQCDNLSLGGAGNVLNNILQLNKNTQLLSIVEKKYIGSLIDERNIINVHDDTYKNVIKTRYYSMGHQCVRIDSTTHYVMHEKTINSFKTVIDTVLSKYDVVIISDYASGVVNEEIVQHIVRLANKLNILTIVDPKNSYNMFYGSAIIKFNKHDAEKFSTQIISTIDSAFDVCNKIIDQLCIKECIITLSENGCVYKDNTGNKMHIMEKFDKNNIVDVSGAGDTFLAFFVFGKICKLSVYDNLTICNKCCIDVISKKYVAIVDILSIIKCAEIVFDKFNCSLLKDFLFNKKVVMTTGCFDLVHEGHIKLLKSAKELGDILVVALNSDQSVSNLKGKTRPINNLSTRLAILLSIKYIDFIIVFDDNVPDEIYNIIKPDVFVKDDTYTYETIKCLFPNMTNFVSIPIVENKSTTQIISKIKQTNDSN